MALRTLTHRPTVSALALAATGLLATMAPGAPDVIFEDDFDDGLLHPAWEVTLECAKGFTGQESGTEFTVTDIDSLCVDEGESTQWTQVVLRRAMPPTADFLVRADFSWDSEESVRAMQQLRIMLWNGCGGRVAEASFIDAWVDYSGQRYAFIKPNAQFNPGLNDQPLAASASIEIERVGCDVTIRWNDDLILSGRTASPVDAVTLEFGYYAYVRDDRRSHFGTESIDRILLEGEPSAATSDVDCSGAVELGDLLQVLGTWGACPEPPERCRADLDHDGTVDINDLIRVLSDWGDGIICH